jgi:K+ transporter
MMFIWFTMMGVLGVSYIVKMPVILKALNPYYAYQLLTSNYNAFIILGAVFLCTTGAEALYSDLGHCGRKNIQISWIYVKTCLILNYLGQAVWLLQRTGQSIDLSANNPFYKIMPEWLPDIWYWYSNHSGGYCQPGAYIGLVYADCRGGKAKPLAKGAHQLSVRTKRAIIRTQH